MMINKFVSFFTLIIFSLSVFAEHTQEEVEKLLAEMHHAAHMINYDGTFVYGQNNEMTSMQIIHSVTKKGEVERLISLDGSGREVIRSGDTVTCVLPDKKSVVVDKIRPDTEFPPTFPIKIERLSQYYTFHLGEMSMVAGRDAKKLIIKAKDKFRYGHALWVDAKSGLLLKDLLIGADGNIVEQFMFTQINYPKVIDKSRLVFDKNLKKYTWYKAKDSQSNNDVRKSMSWKVLHVPAGFEPSVQRHHKMTMSSMPVEHFMFSDGLSSISVFVEKQMKNSKNLIGGSTMGAVNAYGRAIGDYHVTVVGEVPHITVMMVGDSVEYIKNQ